MNMAFLEGYLTGLALVVLIGPVFFMLLGATLQSGRRSGFAVALGIFLSDILAVTISFFGFAAVFLSPEATPVLEMISGLLLLGIGLRYTAAAPPIQRVGVPTDSKGLTGWFFKGFAVNFVNPVVFMVRLGIIAGAGSRHGTETGAVVFLTGAVLGVFSMDTLKVFFAGHVRRLLSSAVLKWVFRGSGLAMFAFGMRLFVSSVL